MKPSGLTFTRKRKYIICILVAVFVLVYLFRTYPLRRNPKSYTMTRLPSDQDTVDWTKMDLDCISGNIHKSTDYVFSLLKPRLLGRKESRNDNNYITTFGRQPVVPNIVHYIWFEGPFSQFKFYNYVSFLGVELFQKPLFILIHGDIIPSGAWWNRTLAEVPNIYFVRTKKQEVISGFHIKFVQHAADVLRLQFLLKLGGIYIDEDMLLIKSLDPLRKYLLTMGRGAPNKTLNNGVILAAPGSPYLRMWMDTYKTFDPKSWVGNSVKTNQKLADNYPELIHVEEYSLFRRLTNKLIYKTHIDLKPLFGVHIYGKYRKDIPQNEVAAKKFHNTIGDAMTYILKKAGKM